MMDIWEAVSDAELSFEDVINVFANEYFGETTVGAQVISDLEETQAIFNELQGLTAKQRIDRALAAYEEELKVWNEINSTEEQAKRNKTAQRAQALLVRLNTWEPPNGLGGFKHELSAIMSDVVSLNFPGNVKAPVRKTSQEWWTNQISCVGTTLQNQIKAYQNAVEQANFAKSNIERLRTSIG